MPFPFFTRSPIAPGAGRMPTHYSAPNPVRQGLVDTHNPFATDAELRMPAANYRPAAPDMSGGSDMGGGWFGHPLGGAYQRIVDAQDAHNAGLPHYGAPQPGPYPLPGGSLSSTGVMSPRQQMYQAGGMAPGSSVSPQGAAPASGGLAPFTTNFNHPGYQDHVASEQAAQDAREQWRNGPRPVAAPSLSMTPGQPLAEARARYAAARAAADQSLSDRNINTYNSMGRPAGYSTEAQDQMIGDMVSNYRRQQSRNDMTSSQRAFVDGHSQIMANRAAAEPVTPGLTPEQQQVAANWYNQQANRVPQAPTPSQQASAYNLNVARQRYDQRQRDIRTARGVAQNPNSVASQELLNARAQLEFQNKQQQQAYLDRANHDRSMRDEYAKRLVHGQPVGPDGKPTSVGGATRPQAIQGYNQYNQQAQGLGGFQPNQLSIQPGMPVQPIAPGAAPVAPGAYSDPPTAPQASMLQRTGQFVESSLSPILSGLGGTAGFMGGVHLASKFFPAGRIASIALPAIGGYLGTLGTDYADKATGFTKGISDITPDEVSGLAIPAAVAAGAYAYSKGKGKAPVNPGSGANPAAGAATPTYGPFPATPSGGSWPAGMKPGAPAPTPSPTPSSTYGPFPATPSGTWPSGMKPGAPAPTPAAPTGGQWPTMVKPTPATAPAPRPATPKSAPPSGVAPNPFTPKPVPAPTPTVAAPTPAAATPVTPPVPAASAATPPPAAVGDYIKSQKAKRESLPTSVQADMMKALEAPTAPPASPPAPSVTVPVAGKPARTRSKPKAKEPESAIAAPTPTPEATPESTGISDQMMKTLMDVPPKRSKATPAPAEPAPAPPPVQTPDEILNELIHGKAPKPKASKAAPAPAPEPAPKDGSWQWGDTIYPAGVLPSGQPAAAPIAPKSKKVSAKPPAAAKPASNPTEIVPGEKVAEPKKPRTKRESTSTPAAPADVAPTVTPKSKAVKKKEIGELDPNVVERALDTTSALQGNSVTRGQAMVHAKKLYSKGLLSDNDMSNLKVMSKDRDLDGEDLLSDMLSSVGKLQEQLADIRKAKRGK